MPRLWAIFSRAFLYKAARSARLSGAVLLFLGACTQSHTGDPAALPASTQGTLELRIIVPPRAAASAAKKSQYVSPSTASIVVVITPVATGDSQTLMANLLPTSANCASSSTGTICGLAQPLAPGTYSSSISTYSAQNGGGSVLSQNQHVTFTIAAGVQNNLSVTLYGVPARLSVTPTSSNAVRSAANGSYTIFDKSTHTFTINAYDAQGNIIAGPGSATLSVSSSNSAYTLTPSTQGNTFTLAPDANHEQSTTQLTLSATFNDASICANATALCQSSVTVNALNVTDDDWTTFAHDQMRSGAETQSTGITSSNVANLSLRWNVQIPSPAATWASPVVYNGNVIVTNEGSDGLPGPPPTIYDYSAVDGTLLWSTVIPSPSAIQGTPVIDPAKNMLFVGDMEFNQTTGDALPSNLWALNLSTGAIVWSAPINGTAKTGPVVANGMVFVGTGGGDPPVCINGGVTAVNEATGQPIWQYYVNTLTNPGGGGSSWGAIAFDGTRLILGTGNTCQPNVTVSTADGAVALDPATGNVLWHFSVDTTSTDDWDTGGGVTINGSSATFLNKNGTLYTLDSATGNLDQQTVLKNDGITAGFATPTIAGGITIVGTGSYAGTLTSRRLSDRALCFTGPVRRRPSELINGYYSMTKGVGSSGNVLWSIPTQARSVGYVARSAGIAYVGLDNVLAAIDPTTGQKLWSYTTSPAPYFEASPAIVPSGLYAVDFYGHLYAFSLPF